MNRFTHNKKSTDMEWANDTDEAFTTALDYIYDENFNLENNEAESALNHNRTVENQQNYLLYPKIDQKEIDELSHQRAVYHKPIMGTNALMIKMANSLKSQSEQEKRDTELIQELINHRFSDIFSYYRNRSLKRQKSRASANSGMTDTEDDEKCDEDVSCDQLQFTVPVNDVTYTEDYQKCDKDVLRDRLQLFTVSANAVAYTEDYQKCHEECSGNRFQFTVSANELTDTDDYQNCDKDVSRDQLQFMVSVDEINLESSLENLISDKSSQNLTKPSRDATMNVEYDSNEFLRAALGDEFMGACTVSDSEFGNTQVSVYNICTFYKGFVEVVYHKKIL